MNKLEEYFYNNDKNLIHKNVGYFNIYNKHFERFIGKEIVVLEIGISHGGSLQMWRDYFGDKAKICGMDINPNCKKMEKEGFPVFIGSQSDRNFLREVKKELPKIDILIDDGGHTMEQQIVTFEELYDTISLDGVYLCEDLHTSYWKNHGGGYKRNGTFIEYSKNFIDHINAWYSQSSKLSVTDFSKTSYSLTFYRSVLVIEKGEMKSPKSMRIGQPLIPREQKKYSFLEKVYYKIMSVLKP